MSFSDPQSVTISGSAISLPRVNSAPNASTYQSSDGAVRELFNSIYGKRNRRVARIEHSKYAADPLFPAQNTPYSMSCYLTVDVPKVGYTVAEQKAVIDGFIAQLNATSGALITKLLGGEN